MQFGMVATHRLNWHCEQGSKVARVGNNSHTKQTTTDTFRSVSLQGIILALTDYSNIDHHEHVLQRTSSEHLPISMETERDTSELSFLRQFH